jgi:hypothetical protein
MEITDATVYVPAGMTNATPASGTLCHQSPSQGRYIGTTLSLNQKSSSHFGSASKGSGLKSFLGTGSSALKNAVDSMGNSSQTDLERGQSNDGVELQSFAPRLEDDDEKPEIPDDGIALPFGAAPTYRVIDMNVSGVPTPSNGVRIDVEKTSM